MLRDAYNTDDPYGLLLTDKHMPGMDGFMVLEQVRADGMLPVPTVMMLSSDSHHGDANRCKQMDVAAYLLKPVRKHELQESIARALGVRRRDGDPSLMGPQTAMPTRRAARQCLNILLAEDNEVNLKVAIRMLQKRGHSVTVALNGREASQAVERDRYDLVLMDVQMPEMDGIEATQRIRASEIGSGRHQAIVAMTALVVKGDRERCLSADMDGYLSKPIRPQELDAILETYINQKSRAVYIERNDQGPYSTEIETSVNTAELLDRIDGDQDFVAELAVTFRSNCSEKMNAHP